MQQDPAKIELVVIISSTDLGGWHSAVSNSHFTFLPTETFLDFMYELAIYGHPDLDFVEWGYNLISWLHSVDIMHIFVAHGNKVTYTSMLYFCLSLLLKRTHRDQEAPNLAKSYSWSFSEKLSPWHKWPWELIRCFSSCFFLPTWVFLSKAVKCIWKVCISSFVSVLVVSLFSYVNMVLWYHVLAISLIQYISKGQPTYECDFPDTCMDMVLACAPRWIRL